MQTIFKSTHINTTYASKAIQREKKSHHSMHQRQHADSNNILKISVSSVTETGEPVVAF